MNYTAAQKCFDDIVDDFCKGEIGQHAFTELAMHYLRVWAGGSKSDTVKGTLFECLVHSVDAAKKRVDGVQYAELRGAMHRAQDRFFAK